MIATTFRGENVYLLPYRPNWAAKPELRLSELVTTQRSNGGREAREAQGATLRAKFTFSLCLFRPELNDFSVALQRLQNTRVLCPFWPAATLYYSSQAVFTDSDGNFYVNDTGAVYVTSRGEVSRVMTGVWLSFEPQFTTWEIHETDTPTSFIPSALAIRVPIMRGFFEKDPDPEPLKPTLVQTTIQFREESTADMALRCVDQSFEDGPSVGGRTPKIFPLRANWALDRSAGAAHVDITRQDIGFGRFQAETYYPQPAARLMEMGFTASNWSELAKLIGFFRERQGPLENFWVHHPLHDLSLTAASSASSADIFVDRVKALGDNRYIGLHSGLAEPVIRKVVALDNTTNKLTLNDAPGVFQPASTRVSTVMLARFRRPELRLTFFTDRIAECSLAFIEVPTEYIVPSGETPGVTVGSLGRKAFLFRFVQFFPDTTRTYRFTSYEQDITAGDEVFLSRLIEHGEITRSLDPERTKVKLRVTAFPGNPLMEFLPARMETVLWCEVLSCSPSDAGTTGALKQLFIGKVKRPRFRGNIIEAEVVHLLQDLDENVPTKLYQPSCNWTLFDTPCVLRESDWTFSANVGSVIDAHTLRLNTITRLTGSMPTLSADYFRSGMIWGGSGVNYGARTIYGSAVPISGVMDLTISHEFINVPTTVYFSPGCDKSRTTCINKFGNYQVFGGYPFAPAGNPSLVAAKATQSAGGKK